MPEYLAPGVYIEEVESGPKPIEGVSTSTVGFLGETERGPTEPKLVTSFAQFERHYGGFKLLSEGERLSSTYLPYGVDGFFRNGGLRCFVGRVEATDQPTATAPLRASEGGGSVPRVDFGAVAPNRESTKSLTLTNEGTETLLIDDVVWDTTQPFEVGTPTTDRLEPGDVSTVEVTFGPEDDTGDLTETLTVSTTDTEGEAVADLEVVLRGRAAGALAPERLTVEFDPTVVTLSSRERITLTNRSETEVEVTGVQSSDENAFTGHVEPTTLGAEGTAKLVVEFAPETPSAPDQPETETITVEYSTEDRAESFDVAVTGRGLPALTLSDSSVDFGRLDAEGDESDPVTVTVTNRSRGEVQLATEDTELNAFDDPFADAGTRAEVAAFSVTAPGDDEAALAQRGAAEISVTYTAGPPADGRSTAGLRIPYTVDGGQQEILVVDLYGSAPTPLGAEEHLVAFEDVLVTDTPTSTVVLTSHSDDDIDIGAMTVTDENDDPVETFVPSVEETSLAGDVTTTTLSVRFEPTDLGTHEATLTIPYTVDTADGTPVEIDLVGTATHALDAKTSVVVGSIRAVGPGMWGRNVAVVVENGTLYAEDNPVFKLTIRYWSRETDAEAAREHGPLAQPPVVPEPDVETTYDNLTLTESSSNYVGSQVNGSDALVRVEREGTTRPSDWTVEPTWLDASFTSPRPAVTAGDYAGETETGSRTGLAAFEQVDEISLVCAPDQARDGVTPDLRGLTDELVDHCAKLEDRFAILQSPMGTRSIENLRPPRDTDYGAYYFPSIKSLDPVTRVEKDIPAVGHLAGIYARSDTERGVHKAPANEVVRGAVGLSVALTKEEQGVLNPRGVNVIRDFRGRGIRVWGARTMSSDPSWKYVNVRRLFIFLEESIEESTQWVVFEPNANPLWSRVSQTVRNFLLSVWRDGMLMGTTPEEAFFVKCDRTTMTQNDIDNGRLVVLVGVAAVKPAEFVVFRIAQKTVESQEA